MRSFSKKEKKGVLNRCSLSTHQENPASPPAAPVPPSSSVLNPADNAYKFQIDGDKTSTNFL